MLYCLEVSSTKLINPLLLKSALLKALGHRQNVDKFFIRMLHEFPVSSHFHLKAYEQTLLSPFLAARRGKIYFRSWFQKIQSIVTWHHTSRP
jgi:hypothetical protein